MKIDLFYSEEEKSTQFVLMEEVDFIVGVGAFTIPVGFVSDGASIPRFWWGRVQPFDGRYLRAFLKHDYLYSALNTTVSRAEADKLLYDDLRAAGMGYITANEVYYAVRTFGGSCWKGQVK